MIKNPSFYNTLEMIRNNLIQNDRKHMTVACLIDYDGTMILYNNVEEMFNYAFPDFPDQVRVMLFTQYLRDTSKYFFHMSYEYIPDMPATPEMTARIMTWHEALLCQGINLTPANIVDHSGKSYTKVSALILDEEKFQESGQQYHSGDMEFLKTCKKDSLVTRFDARYMGSPMYCIEINDKKELAKDPGITFKDCKNRPAVIRKSLHEFIETYAKYMSDDSEFETFIWPDGTAANMSDYSQIEVNSIIPDDVLDTYIRSVESSEMLLNMDSIDRFAYRLEMLRIVCIVGMDSIIMPHPITPQQAVFLEGLAEFGVIDVNPQNIFDMQNIYSSVVAKRSQKTTIPLVNGFMYGGTSYFCKYMYLSPDMKRKVDSVMNISDDDLDAYLFNATGDDKIFVISSKEAS